MNKAITKIEDWQATNGITVHAECPACQQNTYTDLVQEVEEIGSDEIDYWQVQVWYKWNEFTAECEDCHTEFACEGGKELWETLRMR